MVLMAEVTYSVRRHGSVVTFRSGRYVEHFDADVIGMVETWERIKWAAITCGVKLKEQTLDDALMSVVRAKIEQEGRQRV